MGYSKPPLVFWWSIACFGVAMALANTMNPPIVGLGAAIGLFGFGVTLMRMLGME